MPIDISQLFGNSEVENLEEAVKDRLGDKYVIVEEEAHIPKSKFEEVRQEKQQLQEQLDQTQEQLENLSDVAGEKEELEEKLANIKQEYEEFKENAEKRRKMIQKKTAAEKKLLKSGANEDAVDLLIEDLDLEEMELEDDGLEGFEDQLETVKEKRPTLFAEEEVTDTEPQDGDNPDDNPYQQQYNQAIENGNTKEAIKIKQKAFNEGYIIN